MSKKRILPKNPTPEQASSLCGKIASPVFIGDKLGWSFRRCNRPRYCDFCLSCKAQSLLDKIKSILENDGEVIIYRLDYALGDEKAATKKKRNISLKKPDLLVYLPHDNGTTLLTTESRYGGEQIKLGLLSKYELKKICLNRDGSRCRVTSYKNNIKVDLDIEDEEEITVSIESFVAKAPPKALNEACERANTLVDGFGQRFDSTAEKIQTKANTFKAIIEKQGYVTQPITQKVKVVIAKNTSRDDLKLEILFKKLRQMASSLT